MVTTIADPRKIQEDWFQESGSPEEQLKFLLNYAVLAPSIYNSQPWRFKVTGSEVAVYADRTRALPVVDPDDREMIISCGAALFNLRVALRHFGFVPTVHRFPQMNDPDLLATVEMGARRKPDEKWSRLFDAIKRRHTYRSNFEPRSLPKRDLKLIRKAAAAESARLDVFTKLEDRSALASLIAAGDEAQSSSKGFRRELASWLHPARTSSLDGIPGYANGIQDWLANAGPAVVRTFDWGSGKAARDMQLAEGSPALAVLSVAADGISDWLKAGQSLQRVLLTAVDLGLAASFLNQPVEVGDLRPEVAKMIDGEGTPQLILRIGYGNPVRSTPRRPVREVMKRY